MALDEHETPADAFKRMLDPAQPTEELDPELARYLEDSELFGQSIRHPLYYSIVHHERLNAIANAGYRLKKEALRKARAEGAWSTYVWLHERPYRLWALTQIAEELTDRRHWKLLGEIWTDSENIHECYDEWLDALHSPRKDRWAMMATKRERERWRGLHRAAGVAVPIYRGFCHDGGEHGPSWTLARERGVWFAQRFATEDDPARLASGICDAEHIVAYFDQRGEDEVLILPEHVHIVSIREVGLAPPRSKGTPT